MPGPIGERVRRLRLERHPRMTQRELAERAQVSVDLISKLEQGVKQTALLVTLHRIARALDVGVSDLLDEPSRVDGEAVGNDVGLVAIRRALLARSPRFEAADAAPEVGELERSARFAWGAYWAGRYDTLGTTLPTLIDGCRAADGVDPSAATAALLAETYGIVASTLVHLGQLDLAYLAMDRALTASDQESDELHQVALTGWMSWILLHHTGTLDQAHILAADAADRIRTYLNGDDPKAISVFGSLSLSAATAAARDEDPSAADEHLAQARRAADRLSELGQPVRRDYESTFSLPQVIMQSVDIAVVTDRPGHALDLARDMPADADLPLAARARHLADRAYAFTALGQDEAAVDVLLTIERMAPHWLRFQVYPQTTIRELIERERRARTPRLRGLAQRIGIVA